MNNAICAVQAERNLPDHRRYEARVCEIKELFENSRGSTFEFGYNMFLLGFTRGRSCERNLLKKAKRGAAV